MNQQNLSDDTEAVLLLCGRFGGEKQDAYQPLTPREYGELAKWLIGRNLRPSDLMADAGRDALANVEEARMERKRIEFLLGRGTAMALALERWARGGLWVISRGDAEFPKRLRRQLKHATPPLLYGAGDKSLLNLGGLAIIGSRDATEAALEYTRSVAARCAKEGLAVVSGGARGVDAAAMQGANEAGGHCIGVLASDLLKASLNRQNRIGLQEGRLVLVSPFFPEAGFNAGNAMGRNRYIYTLADQALVIDSALRSGGTWEGAVENLKHRWVPLYVRSPGEGPGNAALIAEGGLPFKLMAESEEKLAELFNTGVAEECASSDSPVEMQPSLFQPEVATAPLAESIVSELVPEQTDDAAPALTTKIGDSTGTEPAVTAGESSGSEASAPVVSVVTTNPFEPTGQSVTASAGGILDMYVDFSSKLEVLLREGALSEEEIAIRLCIEKGQAKVWLKRAGDAGFVEKQKRPVRYGLGRQNSLC